MKMDRYLARAVLTPTLLVLALLITLDSIYLFIDEQSHIGQGDYGMGDAMQFVMLSVPQQFLDLMPAAALIGAMIGLGELGRYSEITALRAAGVSVARIASSLAVVGILLMLGTGFIGEYVAPQATAIARQQRSAARTQHEGAMQGTRFWMHDGTRFIRVDTEAGNSASPSVTLFDIADDGRRLRAVGRAGDVDMTAANQWMLRQYREVRYGPDGVQPHEVARLSMTLDAGATLLDVAVEPPHRSVAELARLARELRDSQMNARVFVFALWSRIAHAVAVPCCVLLALPFAFGALRSAHPGLRILLSIGIGIVFVLFQQITESGALLSSLSPAVLAWTPTGALAIATGLLIWRIRT
jgi:lipopolysaccharide export system permease protein